MSRVDELIAEHCPDGVEYRALGEVMKYEQPTKYLVSSADYGNDFSVPVLTAGQTFVLGYTNESHGIYEASQTSPVVIFDDFTTAFKWVDFPFKAKSSAMKMLTETDDPAVLLKYLYYVMQTIRFEPRNHARQWIGTFSRFRVPVPPLPVQQEIVSILDQFTALEAELEAELEARRKQYEYYRRELLKDLLTIGSDWSNLGQISTKVSSGGTPSTGNDAYYEGAIPWLRTQEVDFNVVTSTSMTITDVGLENSAANWVPADTVIVAMYGATAAKVAVAGIALTTNQACCNLQIDESKADYRFVYHWIASSYLKLKSLGEGSQSNLNAKKVRNFPIPVPPLEEQRRIVAILDEFDALVNDISVGLPAELAARRKQYEYYRDKLLTFEEKKS